MALNILVIDDERLIGHSVERYLEAHGIVVDRAESAVEGLALFERINPDVVLLDLQLPDSEGLDLIPTLARHPAHPAYVIIITAFPNAETAVAALRRGACDYLVKPLNLEMMLQQLLKLQRLIALQRSADQGLPRIPLPWIRSSAPAMRAALRLAQEAAQGDQPFCLIGEQGTGRHALARAIHGASERSAEPFFTWVPSADPTLQTERLAALVGAEPQSVAAHSGRVRGLLSQVSGGTLVLQEIHQLAPREQKVLSQLLINRTYQPLGGGVHAFPGRLLMTAQPMLLDERWAGTLNQEFRRLAIGRHLLLPPLRERQGDFKDLIQALIADINREHATHLEAIEPSAVLALSTYSWPGNLAELRLVLEQIALKTPGRRILRKHLPSEFFGPQREIPVGPEAVPTLAEIERAHINRVLELTQGNQTKAAELLDIARSTLINKLKQYQHQPSELPLSAPEGAE